MKRTQRIGMLAAGLLLAGTAAAIPGCVERIMKISTRPAGATVRINDEEVGTTPVSFSFLWYGDYDIVIRKDGYETLKTHYRVDAPWYQLPPFDLFAEHVVPGTIRDEHVLPEYELTEAATPTVEQVVKNAAELRDRAFIAGGTRAE